MKETVKGLRALDLHKVVSETNREISKEVQAGAQSKPATKTGKRPPAAMIGRRAGVTSASLVLRYGRFPWAAGAEFGSIAWRQFRPWVGNRYTRSASPGYMIGSTIKEKARSIERTYRKRLLAAIDKATR